MTATKQQPIAGYRISDPSDPTIKPWLSDTPDDNGYTSEPLYAGAAPAAVAGPAWDKTRDSLATLLLGLARRPFLDFDVACIALDAATEPGMPLAYMRGAPVAPALEAPAAPEGWREQFSASVHDDLAAADNQDVPLEEYPARILKVLDAVVGPRHPAVILWRNDAIQACIAIAYKYCRDPESFQYLKQDLQGLVTAVPTLAAAPQAPAAPSVSKREEKLSPPMSPSEYLDHLLAAPAAPILSAAPLPVMPRAITSGLGLDDSGEEPAYCVMAAFRQEDDARYALSILSAGLGATAAPAAPAEAQRLAQFLQRMRTHLGSCRESAGTYNQQAWDDYERAWTMLLGMAAPAAPAVDAETSEDAERFRAMANAALTDDEVFGRALDQHPDMGGDATIDDVRAMFDAAIAAQAKEGGA